MRRFPQNNRDQRSSLLVHRHGLAEILRPDKMFLFITVLRVRTGQPFLDSVSDPQAIDACGFAIFAGDTEFGAIPHFGTGIRRDSWLPLRVDPLRPAHISAPVAFTISRP